MNGLPMLQVVTERVGLVAVRDVPAPAGPGPGEVLLAIERVGICGSDAHIYDGSHPYLGYPVIQGHEIVGVVGALGENITVSIHVGDRVVVEPADPCRSCVACRRGRSNCCVNLRVLGVTRPGGLSECLAVAAVMVHPVGDLHPDAAVLVEPLAVALHCVDRADVAERDTVLILGCGSIGRAAVLAAHSRGARVIVADNSAGRCALGVRLGADATVGLAEGDLAAAVAEFTNGDGCTVAIDTTGSGALLRASLDLVAYSGSVVVVGISEEDLNVPVALLSRKEISVLGSRNSSQGAFPRAIELAKANSDALRSTITDRFVLEDAGQAIRAVAGGTSTGKVVVEVKAMARSREG